MSLKKAKYFVTRISYIYPRPFLSLDNSLAAFGESYFLNQKVPNNKLLNLLDDFLTDLYQEKKKLNFFDVSMWGITNLLETKVSVGESFKNVGCDQDSFDSLVRDSTMFPTYKFTKAQCYQSTISTYITKSSDL